ncbi:hypothetical protein Bpfe_031139 [Biomphalaria pfeifferi]|uniref:Uncharacterized protein n=1 Tax=Biomphalaria pfeifferi TaxID=112525 RepID=A0AAD8ANB6_BIOPF|nr:hypothetical protein Bpfe_031139 [Biomphalaria pfeifferi]
MTTFSQLVDDVVKELLRPDQLENIATYTNQTIRELHIRPSTQSQTFFDANRVEEELAVLTDGPWLWSIPSVTRFQKLEAIYCPQMNLYIQEKTPSVAFRNSDDPFHNYYWYRTGPQIAVAGALAGLDLQLSYFMYPRTFPYKLLVNRIVKFDADLDAYVLIAGGGTPTQDQIDAETAWPLQRWPDAIKEGVRAKLFKRLGDSDRTRMAYSAFESMRMAVWNSEPSS